MYTSNDLIHACQAIIHNDIELLNYLLGKITEDYARFSLLTTAIRNQNVKIVSFINDKGFDVKYVAPEGLSLLHFPSSLPIYSLLIRRGALRVFNPRRDVGWFIIDRPVVNCLNVLVIQSAKISRIGSSSAFRKFPTDLLPSLVSCFIL